jgi:hypothetical protein
MISHAREDHARFVHALITRDVRRLRAVLDKADLPDATRDQLDNALAQLETRTWALAFHDPVNGILIQDQDTYSDGRPVTTTIDWHDGYTTLVHCPNPADGINGGESDELSEEVSPDAL